MRADLGKQLIVPQEIATTNLRPEAQRVVYFVEVTVQWEAALETVYETKKLRYTDLAAGLWSSGDWLYAFLYADQCCPC